MFTPPGVVRLAGATPIFIPVGGESDRQSKNQAFACARPCTGYPAGIKDAVR